MKAAIIAVAIVLLGTLPAALYYFEHIANPRVIRELIEEPDGERAERVMLVTLPGGRRIPVNYLREGERVYAGADGSWWEELAGDGQPVTLLIRGETYSGQARAILDDPSHTKDVFARLRPDALPGFGTLVEVQLADAALPPSERN